MSEAPARSLAEVVRALPKAELHVHLEGSIGAELALRLAERHDLDLPGRAGGLAGVREAYRLRSFDDFIRLYVALSSGLVTVDDFAEVIDEVALGLRAQGVRYAEVTFSPMTHRARGVPEGVLVDGLAEGRARALSRHGVRIAWVFDIVRCFPDQALPTLELALAQRGRGVIALGVGGPEGPRWPVGPELAQAFDRARAEGLHRVPHAGEQTGAWAIREAIDRLHAERIGHGFRALEDPELIARLVAEQIPLELCPGSNVALGWVSSFAEHPLRELAAAGVAWSLASDDPPLFGTTLVDEYLACARAFGWGLAEVAAVARAGVEQSFLSVADKRELIEAQCAVLADLAGGGSAVAGGRPVGES